MVKAYSLYPPKWRTPLVRLEEESKKFNCKVYAKLEIVNPTGVHKDRESAVVVNDMRKKGYISLACASSGNAAISISAFAYMNRLQAHIFLGSETPPEKLSLVKMFHPIIHMGKGDYRRAVEMLKKFVAGKKIYNANAGFCEAKLIGNSYIGNEIAQDLEPDYVICPTNNGTHFVGVGMGIRRRWKRTRMIAAISQDTVIAHSIKGFYHLEEPKISRMVEETHGEIISLEDNEMRNATISLARQGIIAEPASAASIAVLPHLKLSRGDTVCCTITGSGLKYPSLIAKVLKEN
ncbi:PLP-dependent lyase/thiolase [[Eubacterium] cellulosolvens]